MKVAEAQRRGYGIANTATRLLLRSPHASPETYTQNVSALQLSASLMRYLSSPGSWWLNHLQPHERTHFLLTLAASKRLNLDQLM